MNIGKKQKNHITYVCDLEDCEEIKTTYKSLYVKKNNHYCSQKCKHIGSRGVRSPGKMTTVKLNKIEVISNNIRKYFKGVNYETP